MQAEILSIGSELLTGDITDTNATFLARELVELGIELRRVTQVGDDLNELVAVLGDGLERADLLVCTGGIGPTPDDLTREAIAQLLGETMQVDPELERTLRAYFAQRSYPMPERNLKQATLIPSARPVRNRSGTAPGWWVETRGKLIVTMPGVPREMKTIWREEITPCLAGRSGNFIAIRTVKTFGLGESTVAEMLGPLLESARPAIGTYAKLDGVHVTVRASAPTEADAVQLAERTERQIRDRLGGSIWGGTDDSLGTVVASLLSRRGLTVSSSERASRGRLAVALSDLPPQLYAGGLVGSGLPPPADLTVVVTEALRTSVDGVEAWRSGVSIQAGDAAVVDNEVQAASEGALAERSTVAALHLLRQHLSSEETRRA